MVTEEGCRRRILSVLQKKLNAIIRKIGIFPTMRFFFGRYGVTVVILALIYLAAGKMGLSLAVAHKNVSLVWPPTGIALSSLLILGRRFWPGVFLGAFLVNVLTAVSLPTAFGIAVGNTLEAFLGATLLLRIVGFQNSLGRVKDVLGFIILGGLIATTVSATIGVSSLCLGGSASWNAFGPLWWQWWVGDALGALVVAPFLLTWSDVFYRLPHFHFNLPKTLEIFLLLLSLALIGQITFGGSIPIKQLIYLLIFPSLIWAAIRFGPAGATAAIVAISCIAVGGTVQGVGPFVGRTLDESLVLLQLFMAVVVLITLILAATTRALRKANEELLRLSEIKSEFTSMVSHELRTPLSSIKEGIGLVLDGIDGPVTEGQKETLGIAKNNVDRLARLINNVLDYSKLESGKMEMIFEKTDMRSVVQETYELMKLAVHSKGIDFQKEVPEEPVVCVCDQDKMKQVLINLIDNSVKFTNENGRIDFRLGRLEGGIRIEVKDTGIGIKKEDQERIFEMFGQVSSRGRRKRHGSGIGLAVCKLIVDQHKGTIEVTSRPGEGSTFAVIFPDSLPAGKK